MPIDLSLTYFFTLNSIIWIYLGFRRENQSVSLRYMSILIMFLDNIVLSDFFIHYAVIDYNWMLIYFEMWMWLHVYGLVPLVGLWIKDWSDSGLKNMQKKMQVSRNIR